ncbi:N-acetylglucosaminidase, partial [Bacillus pumilus]
GQAFITAAKTYHINEIYLISHALLETGNGGSILANGTMFNGKKVYNMYGIGAYDSNPNYLGAKYAYEQQWFTPEAAIIGGAKFIGNSYINHATYKQDTIYKMRWSSAATHQYATDIGWAYKQVTRMYSLYNLLDNYTLYYDIPVYNK